MANGFEFYEAAVFIDVIGWNYLEGDGSTQLISCGLTREVRSTFNQKINVDILVDEIDFDDFDALAIPGGFEDYGFYVDAYSEVFSTIIKKFNEKNKLIGSICTGALPVANSGIMVNRRATTYNLNAQRQQALTDFGAILTQLPIVVDQNVITSWNPSTALEVAFLLLEKLTSEANVNTIKKLMGFIK